MGKDVAIAQFGGSLASKEYICLCPSERLQATGWVAHMSCTLKRTQVGSETFRVLVAPDGRRCVTCYDVLGTYRDFSGEDLALLSVRPATGFTHQIRVHMSSISMPIVGDTMYNHGS